MNKVISDYGKCDKGNHKLMQQKVTKAEGGVGLTDKGWSWEAFLRKQNYIFLFPILGYIRTVGQFPL